MKRLLSVLVLLAVAISPVAVLAQTDEPETEPFTSLDEQLTLSYPMGWAIEELPAEAGLPGVQMANSPETLERLLSGGTLETSEQGIVLMLMPSEFLGFAGIVLADDPTATELTEALARSFTGAEPAGAETEEPAAVGTEEALVSGTQLGTIELVELPSGQEAGIVTYADPFSEGVILAFELKEDLAVVLISITLPGEQNETFDAQVVDLAGSVNYAGTAEELVTALMGGVDMGATEEAAEPDAAAPAATEAVG